MRCGAGPFDAAPVEIVLTSVMRLKRLFRHERLTPVEKEEKKEKKEEEKKKKKVKKKMTKVKKG